MSGFAKFVLAVILLVVLIGVCGGGERPSSFVPSDSSTVHVSLQIRGRGDLTYNNAGGNTEQRSGAGSADGEWGQVASYRAGRGEFVYLSIQNSHETGSVECRILVDGEVIESARSSGAYVIASCSGSADTG